jgi:N-acetylglucosamine kinase-like BadF-type ATPase
MLVGVDGGWTKTALALCDANGRLLARTRGPGTAIVGLPTHRFFDVVEPLLDELCRLAGIRRHEIQQIALGLSGVDFDDEQPRQHAAIAGALKFDPARLVLVNDGIAALCGASSAARLVVVQHGSGITLAWRAQAGQEQVFDSLDVGAVFDLRREATIRVARMIDGRAQPAALLDRVLQHCGVPARRFAEWVFRDGEARSRQAQLAAVVFDAWRSGEAVAGELVRMAADDYVLAVRAMGVRLGAAPFHAAFSGGVINQGGEEFQRLLSDRLAGACPQAVRTDVALPPEAGALLIAGRRAGAAAEQLFERLHAGWECA